MKNILSIILLNKIKVIKIFLYMRKIFFLFYKRERKEVFLQNSYISKKVVLYLNLNINKFN